MIELADRPLPGRVTAVAAFPGADMAGRLSARADGIVTGAAILGRTLECRFLMAGFAANGSVCPSQREAGLEVIEICSGTSRVVARGRGHR